MSWPSRRYNTARVLIHLYKGCAEPIAAPFEIAWYRERFDRVLQPNNIENRLSRWIAPHSLGGAFSLSCYPAMSPAL